MKQFYITWQGKKKGIEWEMNEYGVGYDIDDFFRRKGYGLKAHTGFGIKEFGEVK